MQLPVLEFLKFVYRGLVINCREKANTLLKVLPSVYAVLSVSHFVDRTLAIEILLGYRCTFLGFIGKCCKCTSCKHKRILLLERPSTATVAWIQEPRTKIPVARRRLSHFVHNRTRNHFGGIENWFYLSFIIRLVRIDINRIMVGNHWFNGEKIS